MGGPDEWPGIGRVLFQSGTVTANTGVALNFTNGLFQWSGGALTGVASNLNVVMVTGTNGNNNSGTLNRGAVFYNSGTVRHVGNGRFDVKENASFENLAGGVYSFELDGSVFTDDFAPEYFDQFWRASQNGWNEYFHHFNIF